MIFIFFLVKSNEMLIRKYVLKEHIVPFVIGLSLLTLILILDRIFDLVDLIIGKGLSIKIVLEVLVLSLPFIVALTIPMAVLVGVVIAFGRLSEDNELLALKSNGVSFIFCLIPVLIASAVVCVGMIYFNNYILPESNHLVKNLMINISEKRPTVKIRENIFIPDFKGYKVYVRKKDEKRSKIEGVTIYELKKKGKPRLILAKRGNIEFSAGKKIFSIILEDGEIHDVDEKNPERSISMKFKRHTINIPLDTELVRKQREYRSDRELSAGAMRKKVEYLQKELKKEKERLKSASSPQERANIQKLINLKLRQISKYMVEIHKKFSIPFACIIFVLLGAPIGMMVRKGGIGIGFGVSVGFFLLYYLFLISGEELADRGLLSPFWAMWLPNVVMGAIGVYLTYLANEDKNLEPLVERLHFLLRRILRR